MKIMKISILKEIRGCVHNSDFSIKKNLAVSVQFLHSLVSVSEEHEGVWLEEKWVLNIGVAGSERSLHDNTGLCLPYFKDWHTGEW